MRLTGVPRGSAAVASSETRSARAVAVLRDVAGRGGRAMWVELRESGHHWFTVQRCVARGWLLAYHVHAPKPYHYAITEAGEAVLEVA